MPGVQRRMFAIASALSLLLCAAACVFWARRHWWYSATYSTHAAATSRRSYGAAACDGRLRLFKFVGISGRKPGFAADQYPYVSNDKAFLTATRKWSFAGFRWYADSIPSVGGSRLTIACFETPFWCIAPIDLIAPATLPMRWSRRAHAKNIGAICLRCGYDLRASNDRCPECGTPIPSMASAAYG
jgi:hypothetical protein